MGLAHGRLLGERVLFFLRVLSAAKSAFDWRAAAAV